MNLTRLPRASKIRYFRDRLLESARATGFRPCRRCNPDGPSIECENAALVAKVCRLIEESDEELSLEELADAISRSPSYFHRVFKTTTGLTPKEYAAADRAKKVREGLASGNTVTKTIYDAGFSSSGRFCEKSTGMLGMTPSQYRAGGANEEIKFAVGQTSLGAILVASSKKGVASILLGGDPEELVRNLQDRFPKARLIGADRDYEALGAFWAEEHGQIISGVGPFLQRRAIERQAYTAREQFVSRGDKAVRAQSMRGRMAMLGLYVRRGAPWFADLRAELLSFPVGRHDDQVDALGLVGQLLDRISPRQKPKPPQTAHHDAYRSASDEMHDVSSSVKLLWTVIAVCARGPDRGAECPVLVIFNICAPLARQRRRRQLTPRELPCRADAGNGRVGP